MKKIKLGNLLEYIDPCCSLVIWTPDDEETPAFEGAAMEVPFYLTKMYLESPRRNNGDGTIDSRLYKNNAIMVLTVVEENK